MAERVRLGLALAAASGASVIVLDVSPVASDPAIAGFSYLTIYEIETVDLRGVFRTLVTRMGTALMPMSDAIAPERAFYDWEVLGPRVLADPAGVAAAAGAQGLPDAAASEESA